MDRSLRTLREEVATESRLTTGIRVLFFVMVLLLIGTFFLPWLRLGGLGRDDSGITLMALMASQWASYFFGVEPIQTGILIVAPVAMMVFTILMLSKYAQGRAAPFATLMVLISVLTLAFGTRSLVDSGQVPLVGHQLAIALSVLLTLHQLAMLVQARLFKMRRFPKAYRVLSIATGRRQWRMGREA